MDVMESVVQKLVEAERDKTMRLFAPLRQELELLRTMHGIPVDKIVSAFRQTIDSPHMRERYEAAAVDMITGAVLRGGDRD
jgi:hypothetical protein